MKLAELAFACFSYGNDNSYLHFLQATNQSPDLLNPEHRKALLIWLNQWGCRQFAVKHHDRASSEILSWYNEFANALFSPDKNLWDLTEIQLEHVAQAFESLSSRTASVRTLNGSTFPVSIGPTGAAKILFAIRRNALVPWDKQIRDKLRYDDSGKSYVIYLRDILTKLDKLKQSCEKNGFNLADLPKQLGRPYSTIPKLIDEFNWVTITYNTPVPNLETFQRWFQWSERD